MAAAVDVLIPTYRRPAALAVTLACLVGQTFRDFRVVIADQSGDVADGSLSAPEFEAAVRVLRLQGHEVEINRRVVRAGMAEQRQFLLDRAEAPFALFLDDDVILEPWVIERLLATVREHGCGFAGSALIGPNFEGRSFDDEAHLFEVWVGRVRPETVLPGTREWARYTLHSAANLLHLQRRLGLGSGDRVVYKVAWVGGCVLFDRRKLEACGGYGFWRRLPPDHCGEDALAQLRVMARYGGCGILPSGAYHQELATTLPERRHNAPVLLEGLIPARASNSPAS